MPVLEFGQQLETCTCYLCGVVFAMPTYMIQKRREDHKAFFCPNGHEQAFLGKTEAEKLRDELARTTARLDQARSEAEHQKRQAIAARGQATRIRNRVHAGVCPCCNRHFTNLQRHMETKHPEQKERT